jgi:hypothetical protein
MTAADFGRLETGLITLATELGELSNEDDYLNLVRALHSPRWPGTLDTDHVAALVEAMVDQARVLGELKGSLMSESWPVTTSVA